MGLSPGVGFDLPHAYLYEVRHSEPEGEGADKPYMPNLIERKLSELEDRLAQGYERFLDCCERGELSGAAFHDSCVVLCELAANLIVRHPMAVADGRGRRRSGRTRS